MSKIKTKVVYHEADLDGIASAAVMLLEKSKRDEDIELIPYDYHKDFNQKLTNGHEVYMIDVSIKCQKLFEVAKHSAEFYLVDHHISFYEDLLKYCDENEISYTEVPFGICKKIDIKQFNFVYYYASHISACELACHLFCSNIGASGKELISILGQYDTWRDSKGKMLPTDKDWNEVVLPIQYSLRAYAKPETIAKIIFNLDNGGSKYNINKLIESGKSILGYLKVQNRRNLEEFSFVFEYDGLNILAMNTSNFNSFTFEDFYSENVFDAMLAFNFTGKDWRISLYTTKDNVDILKIAKMFGGGGHKKACGFRIPHNQLVFRKNKLEFGILTLLDLNMIPESYKGVDVNEILKALKSQSFKLLPSPGEMIVANYGLTELPFVEDQEEEAIKVNDEFELGDISTDEELFDNDELPAKKIIEDQEQVPPPKKQTPTKRGSKPPKKK